jgi:hypothetical protein
MYAQATGNIRIYFFALFHYFRFGRGHNGSVLNGRPPLNDYYWSDLHIFTFENSPGLVSIKYFDGCIRISLPAEHKSELYVCIFRVKGCKIWELSTSSCNYPL